MPGAENCIFCRIVRGEVPAISLYEDELTLSFMDINPASDGHALVICKGHWDNLLEVDAGALCAVARTTQRIGRAMDKALAPAGLRIAQFNGAAAGQSVFHYHVHVRPVYEGQPTASHGRGPGDPQRLQALAERIRAAL